MTTPTHADATTAYCRAARYIAAFRARDAQAAAEAIHEAVREDQLQLFAVACAGIAAGLADQLHGDRGQFFLDGQALDSARLRDALIARLATQDDSATN
jgi:hypothetical protein